MLQLFELLGNKAAIGLLKHFAEHPTAEMSFTQLRKETRLAPATLAKWLSTLEKTGLVSHRNIGRNILYRTQREHQFMKQFKILYAVSQLSFQDIGKEYKCEIYLYGSQARGESIEKSDVDLLILADEEQEEIQAALEQTTAIGPLRMQFFTHFDWAQMHSKDPAFYERVEKDKIRIG